MLADESCGLMDPRGAGFIVPHEPRIKVLQIIPEKCFFFKSAMRPLKLTFKSQTTSDKSKGDNSTAEQ